MKNIEIRNRNARDVIEQEGLSKMAIGDAVVIGIFSHSERVINFSRDMALALKDYGKYIHTVNTDELNYTIKRTS